MGPFDGAGVSILGVLFFGLMAFVIWIFNSGRAAAMVRPKDEILGDHSASAGAPPPGFEHFLACDRCAAETERLYQRDKGPQLCEPCFKSEPIPPRHNHPTNHTGTGG